MVSRDGMGLGRRSVKVFNTALRSAAVFLLLSCGTNDGAAVPAYPGVVETTQPDGTVVEVRRKGDEFVRWDETPDGFAIVKDPADGYWKYARPAKGRAEFVPVPGARVGKSDPVKLGLKRNARPDPDVMKAQRMKRRMPVPVGAVSGVTSETSPQRGETSSTEEKADPEPAGPPITKIPVSGTTTIRNVVILAAFSDHWSGSNVLPSKGRTNPAEYNNLFNQVGHVTDGASGSVRDYYNEVSYGKLTVESLVVGWVQLPNTEAYYGANAGGSDGRPREMAEDAIDAAEAAGFDFSQGDSDNDGWVDCLTIIHSGHGEETGGNPANSIWSHQWVISAPVTMDGKMMYTYHTSPALRGTVSSTSIIRIGVICHEMGHFFGMPDLYDYSSVTNGLGRWCVMANGSWNGSLGARPAHFSAWCKTMLGFAQPKQIDSTSNLQLAAVETSPDVHMIRTGMSDGEYFLLENRQQTGFDNTNVIYPGIIIYHIDGKSTNNDLDAHDHPAVKIEEADGNNSLGAKTSSSQAGDVWKAGSGLTTFRDLTGNTNTNAMRYQTHAYSRSPLTGSYSYIELSNFSAPGPVMTYNAKTLRSPVNSSAGAGTFTVEWEAATNAVQYDLQQGSVDVVTAFYDGAEDEETMHENWHIGGNPEQGATGDGASPYAGDGAYALNYYFGGKWYAPVQSLTLKKPFRLKAGTSLSYRTRSNSLAGTLRCQVSNDNGTTWKNLATYTSNHGWTLRTISAAQMFTAGMDADDEVIIRFLANFERAYGFSPWPGYGFALDEISFAGIEQETTGNWSTIASFLPVTSYPVSGKVQGKYAYRVRAFSNGIWQNYGPPGIIEVTTPAAAVEWNLFQ